MSEEPHYFNYFYDAGEDGDEIDNDATPIAIWGVGEEFHIESISTCVLGSRLAATDYISVRAHHGRCFSRRISL